MSNATKKYIYDHLVEFDDWINKSQVINLIQDFNPGCDVGEVLDYLNNRLDITFSYNHEVGKNQYRYNHRTKKEMKELQEQIDWFNE